MRYRLYMYIKIYYILYMHAPPMSSYLFVTGVPVRRACLYTIL